MDKSLLLPMMTMVLMTFAIGLMLLKQRFQAVLTGRMTLSYFKHNRGKAPENVMRWGDHFSNLFELPVLFYVLVLAVTWTQWGSVFYEVGAWLFVLTRVWHAYQHVVHNNVYQRLLAFTSGALILIVMWGGFSYQLLTA